MCPPQSSFLVRAAPLCCRSGSVAVVLGGQYEFLVCDLFPGYNSLHISFSGEQRNKKVRCFFHMYSNLKAFFLSFLDAQVLSAE